MLELIKGLLRQSRNFEIFLVSFENVIEYQYVFDLPIRFEILGKTNKKDFGLVKRIRSIIKEFKPDIIHSWDVTVSLYVTLANLGLNRVLINGFIADAYQDLTFRNGTYRRVKFLTPFCHVIVANSLAGLRGYRIPARKGVCIYNGVDFSRFDHLKSLDDISEEVFGRPKDGLFVAGMVAAFDERKDYPTLISAAVEACRKNPSLVFLLVGDGPQKDAMMKQVPDVFLNRRIYFLGSRGDVESLLQLIDVGLLITPCEGISNAIIEYMASGKPVIASEGGGTSELLEDGKFGFLVKQRSPEEIIDRLERLILDPDLGRRMGLEGSRYVRMQFGLEKMTQSFIELYDLCLQGKRNWKTYQQHNANVISIESVD